MYRKFQLNTNPFKTIGSLSSDSQNAIDPIPTADSIAKELQNHTKELKYNAAKLGIQLLDSKEESNIAVLLDCYYIVGTLGQNQESIQSFLQLERGVILADNKELAKETKKFLTEIEKQFNPYISADNLPLIIKIAEKYKYQELTKKCISLALERDLVLANEANNEPAVKWILNEISIQFNPDISTMSLHLISHIASKYNYAGLKKKCNSLILEHNVISENNKLNNYSGVVNALDKINKQVDLYISDVNLPLITKIAERYLNKELLQKCNDLKERRENSRQTNVSGFSQIQQTLPSNGVQRKGSMPLTPVHPSILSETPTLPKEPIATSEPNSHDELTYNY